MDYTIMSKHGAYPCEITIDEENNRFTVRNSDTTGEFFNNADELVEWLKHNWDAADFVSYDGYEEIMQQIQQYK